MCAPSFVLKVQSLPSRHLASMCKSSECKYVLKYKRSRIETIITPVAKWLWTHFYAFLAFIAFIAFLGASSSCLAAAFIAFFAILLSAGGPEKRCRGNATVTQDNFP